MNARSNISRPGQRDLYSEPIGQSYKGGANRSYYLQPPNRIELELAQESRLVLKAKMARRQNQSDVTNGRDQRKVNSYAEEESDTRNANYRRVQTYVDNNAHEYDDGRQRKEGGRGESGKSKNMISEKSTLDSMNFNRGKNQGGPNKEDDYDRGRLDSDYSNNQRAKGKPGNKAPNTKSNMQNDYDFPAEGKSGRNGNRLDDQYNAPKPLNNVDAIPILPKGNKDRFYEDDNNQMEEEEGDEELFECGEGCGRRFKQSVLPKHEKVCRKVFQTKRKKFDMAQQRLADEDGKLIVDLKKVQKLTQNKPKKKDEGKIAKWKLQSAMLRTQIKVSKGEDVSNTEEAKIVHNFEKQDCVHCPHCGRNFNETAGNRHIPVCAERAKAGKVSKPNNPQPQKGAPSKPMTSTMKEPISKKEPAITKTMTTGLKTTAVKKK